MQFYVEGTVALSSKRGISRGENNTVRKKDSGQCCSSMSAGVFWYWSRPDQQDEALVETVLVTRSNVDAQSSCCQSAQLRDIYEMKPGDPGALVDSRRPDQPERVESRASCVRCIFCASGLKPGDAEELLNILVGHEQQKSRGRIGQSGMSVTAVESSKGREKRQNIQAFFNKDQIGSGMWAQAGSPLSEEPGRIEEGKAEGQRTSFSAAEPSRDQAFHLFWRLQEFGIGNPLPQCWNREGKYSQRPAYLHKAERRTSRMWTRFTSRCPNEYFGRNFGWSCQNGIDEAVDLELDRSFLVLRVLENLKYLMLSYGASQLEKSLWRGSSIMGSRGSWW
ncbi:hypothetical protein C8R43DRAFT_964667 [Mycena crocata]|nr:hypothetical protein C8R43DRAFT_964667 [Mycena crocata]